MMNLENMNDKSVCPNRLNIDISNGYSKMLGYKIDAFCWHSQS
jgi:hypothetical protein